MPRTNGGIIGKRNLTSFGKCTTTSFTSSGNICTQANTRIAKTLLVAGGGGAGYGRGGGGGAAYSTSGAGGSGIVIVRGPSVLAFTGSPCCAFTASTHPGGDKIGKFTASGTLTIGEA